MMLPSRPAVSGQTNRLRTMTVAAASVLVIALTLESVTHGLVAAGSSTLMGMPLRRMPAMWVCVALLVAVAVAGSRRAPRRDALPAAPPRDARRRALLLATMTAALVIDVSKTSTLGFVLPGMRAEYGLSAEHAVWLSVGGLTGTVVGAVGIGFAADLVGRRLCYLLATLSFTITALCGSMPTFEANVVMCFAMGISVGALAPLTLTIMRDELNTPGGRKLCMSLAIVGAGLGFLLAAGTADLLEQRWGWRSLWLSGAYTGALLAVLAPLVPDSAAARTGAQRRPIAVADRFPRPAMIGFAFVVGLLGFGMTTWLPTVARATGIAPHDATTLILRVALVLPLLGLAVVLPIYARVGPFKAGALVGGICAATLIGLLLGGAARSHALTIMALTATLFAVNVCAAIVLPVAADVVWADGRVRATSLVSAATRFGGLLGPLLLAPLTKQPFRVIVALCVLASVTAALALVLGAPWRSRERVRVAQRPLARANP
jgi:MFS family permease